MSSPFNPRFEDLPSKIPLMPLPGAMLLPGGQMPLNIFEPRYIAMVQKVMTDPMRLVGMVQTKSLTSDGGPNDHDLYSVGCAGRITAFVEHEDGRLQVNLEGLSRFDLIGSYPSEVGYLSGAVRWDRFAGDIAAEQEQHDMPEIRSHLDAALSYYFKSIDLDLDKELADKLDDGRLVDTLAMIMPFSAAEKQALLEATDVEERAKALMALLEMSFLSDGANVVKH